MKKSTKIIIGVISILLCAFLITAAFYVMPLTTDMAEIKEEITSTPSITVNITNEQVEFVTTQKTDTGIIFYPGGKVDPLAYSIIMRIVSQAGYTCVIVKMPLNFAFLNINAASNVMKQFPEIKNWYIAGHSLGGAMACTYTKNFMENIKGIILLASFPGEDISSMKNIPVISIVGSHDGLVTKEKFESKKQLLPPNTEYTIIEGGNHAQFGSYGLQQGDNKALISSSNQKLQTSIAIINFIIKNSKPTLN